MLAAGEAPTFVIQVLGHSDCRMLVTIYARHVAGSLGRRDGGALEAMLRRPDGEILAKRNAWINRLATMGCGC